MRAVAVSVALAAVTALPVVLTLAFGHRGEHAVRSMLIPGAGLLEAQPLLAAAFGAMFLAATVAWLRWGIDWSVVAIVALAMAASAAWGTGSHPSEQAAVTRATHEFPLVVLVAGMLGSARAALAGIPGLNRLTVRRAAARHGGRLADLRPTDRCRAVAVLGLAHSVDATAPGLVRAPAVVRPARLVAAAPPRRRGAGPVRVANPPAPPALALAGGLDAADLQRLVDESARSRAGVPASEPTWVRTLDATLAAAALDELGEPAAGQRWGAMLEGPIALRRGHRPAWWWSPLGIAGGRVLDWEHAAATAIAHSRGWIGAGDWWALRKRVLGAAARGSTRRADERLIAAGRVWLALVHDPDAERIVSRPTVNRDPLAVALDRLARHLRLGESGRELPLALGGTA